MDAATFIGPMARPRGRDEPHRQVCASVDQGARLSLGGQAMGGPGNYYTPTVLTHVEPGMTAAGEELFGPVAAIMTARDADHAVAMANATEYGLSAALWTRDADRGRRLARDREPIAGR